MINISSEAMIWDVRSSVTDSLLSNKSIHQKNNLSLREIICFNQYRTFVKEERTSQTIEAALIYWREMRHNKVRMHYKRASLTVEAALVMPLFLCFMVTFLYFIQIITIQEYIQSAMTRVGLNLAKTAYVYDDFPDVTQALQFDATILGTELENELQDLAAAYLDSTVLKQYAAIYLNTDRVNHSFILNGFRGMNFDHSSILREDGCIDIIVRYQVRFPLRLFSLEDMNMIQRVRVRGWTGYEVEPLYSMEEQNSKEMVYITNTGTVYHKSATCSHIKLSVRAVSGIPKELRNDNGAKYYPCETCCKGVQDPLGTFYITSDGNRYHNKRDCSGIKRSVKEIPLSEVGSRTLCKRCGK